MIKKILIAVAASAFALTLYTPVASACGGMDKKVAKKEKKQDKTKVADKKQKPSKKKTPKKTKAPKKGTKVSQR